MLKTLEVQTDMGTKRQDIRTLSKRHPKLETLMNRVDKESLIRQHRLQKKDKAPGIDMVTKEVYQENLNENIDNLMHRLKSFSYKPQPVRRIEIDKGNGKKRPLGIPVYEDRLFQGAMADILSDVYEPRFLDCSYGFRPNRSTHDAIKVINDTIMHKKINYMLDCDIKGFFDNVNHEWLMKFLRNDIADPNYLRYIARMLKSGVMIEGKYEETSVGTPQGGLISPILANVYLHYVLDLWFEKCIKKQLYGEAYLVRFADDFLILEHVENVVEFVPKGTSKATGIKWLCNHLDIPLDETYAIGDSVNDLEMLESVGHGIAMGNSMPPVKEIAEYVTSDISDDGVKNALKHYGLI